MRICLLILLIACWFEPVFADDCRFRSSIVVDIDSPGKFLGHYLENDREIFWNVTELAPSQIYRDFLQRINSYAQIGQTGLLRKYVEGKYPDWQLTKLVLDGKMGKIRKINCFESLLFAEQAARKDMIDQPTEFFSYTLKRGSLLKIYVFTVDQAGIGGVGQIHSKVEADLKIGWKPLFNLHNHNFFVLQENINGVVAPSSTDAALFKSVFEEYGLEKVIITNGIDSGVYTKKDIAIVDADQIAAARSQIQ